tara:strand:+ start:1645 stop:1794 length:150 start_codon:yes stop_codon:yes gene_type:complete
MKNRRVVQILYRFSDGTIEVNNQVSVINLNFNWLTDAYKKFKNWVANVD